MEMVLACASMLFSTSSAMALSGLLCESAMIRIAFQSSPIRNLPLSDSFDLAALIFATVTRIRRVDCKRGTSGLSLPSTTHYTDGLSCRARLALQRPPRMESSSGGFVRAVVEFGRAQFVGSNGPGVFHGPAVGEVRRRTGGVEGVATARWRRKACGARQALHHR